MSQQSERAVLASILLAPDGILTARDQITPNVFRNPIHRDIYTAMVACAEDRSAPDIVNVTDELERTSPEVPASAVSELMLEQVNPYGIEGYLGNLIRDARADIVRRACVDIMERVQSERDIDPAAIVQTALNNLPEVGTTSGPQPFSTMAAQISSRLDQQRDGTWNERLTTTGFPTLDRHLGGGLRPGELVVLAGRPGLGKSALGFDIARRAARRQPTLIYSLEMTGLSIFERALADASGLPMNVVRSKRLTTDQHQLLRDVTQRMAASQVYIDDAPALTTEQVQVRTQRFMVNQPCNLVVVDYLEIMGDTNQKSEERRVGEISLKMKHLARRCNVPVILLVQLSREVERRDPPIPVLSDLRYSGSIEANADAVLMLYRNDYYVSQGKAQFSSEKAGTCDVFIRKQRNGPLGQVALGFHAETMSFTDPSTPPAPWEVQTA